MSLLNSTSIRWSLRPNADIWICAPCALIISWASWTILSCPHPRNCWPRKLRKSTKLVPWGRLLFQLSIITNLHLQGPILLPVKFIQVALLAQMSQTQIEINLRSKYAAIPSKRTKAIWKDRLGTEQIRLLMDRPSKLKKQWKKKWRRIMTGREIY